MSPTDTPVRERARIPGAAARAIRFLPYDVRLRREITHRRLAISLVRRCLRVVSLHLMDGLLLAGVVLFLTGMDARSATARPYTPAIVAIILLSLNALSAYDPGDGRRDRKRLFSGVVLALLILACLVAFPPVLPLGHDFLAWLGALGFVALAIGRKAADLAVRQVYARGIGLRRAVIVGSLDEAGRTLLGIRDDRNVDQFVVGHVTPAEADPTALGTLDDLPRLVEEHGVQEVLVASALSSHEMDRVTGTCFDRGIALLVVPSVVGSTQFLAESTRIGGCAVLRLHPARLELPALLIKRGVDVVLAGLALLLLSPVIALLAGAIKLDSPGPVFFKQKRVGLGGRFFVMWKFRSMEAGAEHREKDLAHLNIYSERGTFKVKDDPRVTRMGRVLRRTSLDELPQLLNVLLGDMSIVGPRPALIGDIDRYQPHHFDRLTVMPGITGPWQVSGRNLITDFETIVQMESAYIRDWSLLLDLKIMVRTVGVVVSGEGAY
ncbi:MAG: exopolysaccharide biosynthesis polyprenyl glycosylphosphotransferase [Gemmatimonadetes bacterium]|nr:exopolysaccharide biosynthesis polyprenyl glycosylphosphotransferase [Gemmatimonadota bacterium]